MRVESSDSDDVVFGSQTMVLGAAFLAEELGQDRAVLFAAVCGHVRLVEKLGGAEAQRAIERCLTRMERAVQTCAGRVVKMQSGELMAVFDTADEAAQAAIEMFLRVADLPPVSGIKLEVRAAFSWGAVANEKDGVSGLAVNFAAALAGLAGPGQVVSGESGVAALSPAWRKTMQARDERCGDERVYQLRSEGPVVATVESRPAPLSVGADKSAHGKRLCLRYRGEVITFAEDVVSVSIGRDSGCDVVVHDRRASRQHARIERRGNVLVLLDLSTNGTFLAFHGGKDTHLRHDERVLHGKGG